MAYAAYRESFGLFGIHTPRENVTQWMVLDVTVPSCDAATLRRALAACPQTGVLRCIPKLDENLVRLEIRLPQTMVSEVMHQVMTCVPGGEIGHLMPWRCHLQRYDLNGN
jgi:hypothetical protein